MSKGVKSGQNLNVNVNVNVNDNELLKERKVLNQKGSKHPCNDILDGSKHLKIDPLEQVKTSDNFGSLKGQNPPAVIEPIKHELTPDEILNILNSKDEEIAINNGVIINYTTGEIIELTEKSWRSYQAIVEW